MTRTEKPFVSIKWTKIAPAKGDLIMFDAFGDGTSKRFRVLKREGNISTIISLDENYMSKFSENDTKIIFDDGNLYNAYSESDLDNALNNTYYNSLAENVKNAIIPTNKIQSCYEKSWVYTQNRIFAIEDTVEHTTYYERVTQVTVGNRYVYALDIDDIKDYFNIESYTVIPTEIIKKEFFGDPREFWLSSALKIGTTAKEPATLADDGIIYTGYFSNNKMTRPVFKIDLTNIDYTIENY